LALIACPIATLVCIVVTGNHYPLDALGGEGVLAADCLAARRAGPGDVTNGGAVSSLYADHCLVDADDH
jgi:hypothetical protein